MTTNRLLISALLLTAFYSADAQILPKKQKASVRAPANIKIDGKATEWDNKFQAYNNATDIYYTISNDDENLYLIVQAKYHAVIDNMIRGGITLTINHSSKKDDAGHIAITYPVLRDAAMADVSNMFAHKAIERKEAKQAPINVDDLNRLLRDRSKIIYVEGIKAITDTAISVYNDDNIKAAAMFDNHVNYTYELSVPLKYLGLPGDGSGFSYQIKVNPPADVHPTGHSMPPPPMMMEQESTTDFWGEYILAKK
jgi:hypothetical protein